MTDSKALQDKIIGQIYLSSQLDELHASLTELQELVKDGDIELILEQPGKSLKQKVKYIEKVIDALPSDILTETLDDALEEGDMELFSTRYASDFINSLDQALDSIKLLAIEVAVEFKEEDLREMAASFSQRMGFQTALEVTVNPGLIGGAIIRFGNHISDYSIKSRLDQFTDSWEKAV